MTTPIAPRPANHRYLPHDVRSDPVTRTSAVSPPNMSSVKTPAAGIAIGATELATYKSGTKIKPSAMTYSPRPAYCIPREASDIAQVFASQLIPINPNSTANQPNRLAN